MTAQEQQMLQGLADRVSRTTVADKDTDAEQFIQQTVGRDPDALYVMAQTILVQEYALDQAQRQIADLRAQIGRATQTTAEPRHSFLGNLLGRHDDQRVAAPPPPPPPPVQAGYGGPGVGPGLAYPSGGYPIPNAPAPQNGGFLRSAMQTATGVAAGALAFEGIESLMHGFGHAAGYGTEFTGAGFGGAPREEIVNNYYGDAGAEDRGRDAGFDASSNQDGNDSRFQDASYQTNPQDVSGTADTDYMAQQDDSMLADNVGDSGQGGQIDSSADDSGSDYGGDDAGSDFSGGDSGDFGGDSNSF